MKRPASIAVVLLMAMAACAEPMALTGRADNDMLRFSSMNYAITPEAARPH